MAPTHRLGATTAVVAIIALLGLAHLPAGANAQENVQTRIPNWLTECYQNAAIVNRDTRLPSNMNILIELIRKFEDWPGLNMDIREVASTLVHRFRMDGIERAPGQFVPNVLPFSPSAFQFSKHRVLLARLVPGSGAAFPNGSLNAQERCALHFMLSTSIERHARNDEANVCNQLAQVRSMRIPRALVERQRAVRSVPTPDNFVGDVELLEDVAGQQQRHRTMRHRQQQQGKMSGRYMEEMADDDDGEQLAVAEETPVEDGTGDIAVAEDREFNADGSIVGDVPLDATIDTADEVDNDDTMRNVEVLGAGVTLSQCPVENGAIRTTWGAVSGGPLITGIAAGLQPQSVQTRDLLALSRAASQHHSARQTTPAARVDNRWAATLAGDLAEVTLLQGPITQQLQVGGIGGWNSTSVPRWYFLSQRDRLEMTDAEIRGGLDGLILATNIGEYRNQAQQLRLSQLLDMYYSQRGVFSTNAASCNRRALFAQVAPIATLRAQTEAFSTVLDREMQMRVTLPQASISQFANTAAQALTTYIPQSLNDPSCAATSIVPRDTTIWRASADLYIYVDTQWTFREIQPVIAVLLESLDVNPFGSNYTLLNARDGAVIVPSTNSLSDFYLRWTAANHQQAAGGLNLPEVVRSLRTIMRVLLETEQRESLNTRGSLIALIVPQLATISDADTNFALQEIGILNTEVPDLTLLFLAGGVQGRFARFVRDESRDLFGLVVSGSNADNVATQTTPVVLRIQAAHRRIVNQRCGADWSQNEVGSHTLNQYVERGSVNFYRVLPNFFFRATAEDNRRVRIQGHGYGPITVCTSRWTEQPRRNITVADNDINCQQLLSDSMEVSLRDWCDGQGIIHRCQPLYISVEATGSADAAAQFRCFDRDCRFPDNIRFSVTTENLGCFSGVAGLSGGLLMAVAAAVLVAMRTM